MDQRGRAGQLVAGAASRLERHPAQGGTGPGQQLAHAERLGHVVVRADLQAEDPVHLLGAGGQHDDRHQVVLAELPADCQPVQVGQHPVKDHQVRCLPLDLGQRAAAVEGLLHDVPVGQQLVADQVVQVHLVLDDQDQGHVRARLPTPASGAP